MKMMRNIVVALSLILLSAPIDFRSGSIQVSNILARNEFGRTVEAGRPGVAPGEPDPPEPRADPVVNVLARSNLITRRSASKRFRKFCSGSTTANSIASW